MILIGVAGGSGSGKTTFSDKIVQRLDGAPLAVICQDSYYQDRQPREHQIHGEPNFDHPAAFDWDLMTQHLQDLRSGKEIKVPVYDYVQSRRTEETFTVGPCQAVLFEGIFTLWDEAIRSLLDLKIYLHVDADIRFIRRLHRDVRERDRSLDSIVRQYYDTVRPMHHQFLEPTKQYADMVVGEETDGAADVVAARIKEVLRRND